MGSAAIAAAILCGSASQATAGVTSSSQINPYWVGGSTASDLINYMRNRPFHGDRGDAVANIRPSYGLSVTGKQATNPWPSDETLSLIVAFFGSALVCWYTGVHLFRCLARAGSAQARKDPVSNKLLGRD